jgi:hypothetical protein
VKHAPRPLWPWLTFDVRQKYQSSMKTLSFLIACFLLFTLSGFAAVSPDAAIAKLKSEIPKHSLAQSADPLVRDCIGKYTRSIAQIQPNNVQKQLTFIRSELDRDSAAAEQILATTKAPPRGEKTATSSMRTAAQANLRWLGQLRAYLNKFESRSK